MNSKVQKEDSDWKSKKKAKKSFQKYKIWSKLKK